MIKYIFAAMLFMLCCQIATASDIRNFFGTYYWSAAADSSDCTSGAPSLIVEPMRMRLEDLVCEWRSIELDGYDISFTGACEDGGYSPEVTIVARPYDDFTLSLRYGAGMGEIGEFKLCPGSRTPSQVTTWISSSSALRGNPPQIIDTPPELSEVPGQVQPAQHSKPAQVSDIIEELSSGHGTSEVQMLVVRNLHQIGLCPLDLPPSAGGLLANLTGTLTQEELALDLTKSLRYDCTSVAAFVDQSGARRTLQAIGGITLSNGQTMDSLSEQAIKDYVELLKENGY